MARKTQPKYHEAKPKPKATPNTDSEYATLPAELAEKCHEAATTGNLATCSKHYRALESAGYKAQKDGLQLPRNLEAWPRWMSDNYIKGYNNAATGK